jgi:hypothetical protein
MPPGVVVKKVNYNDPSSLVEALKGQEVLVITMAATAPQEQQTKLIEAAATANVPWILPNEFGGDRTEVVMQKDSFIGEAKAKYRDHIEKMGKSFWIAIVCGFWYEFSLAGSSQGSKRAARPDDPAQLSPAQQNILSGRAGRFVKLTGPGGPDVLSGWPGPTMLCFIFIFRQLFCFL